MNNCRICGKKLGFFYEGSRLIGSKIDIIICPNCKNHMNFLQYHIKEGNKENYKENLKYFQTYIKSGNMDIEAIEEINNVINNIQTDIELVDEDLVEENVKIEIRKNLTQIKKEFKMTTGYNFEGYKISDYIKIVSSEIVLGTGFLSELSAQMADIFGTTSDTMQSKLAEAKQEAQNKLIVEAVSVGANALIGVDIDIMTLAGNLIVVCTNGTAVKVEKTI